MSKKLTEFFTVIKKKNTAERDETRNNEHTTAANSTPDEPSVEICDKPFHPPENYTFPKSNIGKRERSCQASWFAKFPWLHYDERYMYISHRIILCVCKNHYKRVTPAAGTCSPAKCFSFDLLFL